MVMVLPFVLALLAAVFAWSGRGRLALFTGLVTVVVQVAWLLYHTTDTLKIGL